VRVGYGFVDSALATERKQAAMTPKQRVLAAFAGEPTDRVPVHHITFSSRVASELLGRDAHVGGGMQQWREACALWNGPDAHAEFIERSYRDAVDVAKAVGNDIVRVTYWRMPTKPAARIDTHTFRYGESRIMRFDPATELYQDVGASGPVAAASLDDLERSVDRTAQAAGDYTPTAAEFATETRAQRELGDEVIVRVGGVGISIPYDEAWLRAVAARPALVARHLDAQTERAVRRLDLLRELGFTCLWGGGDLAWNDGPFYSPAVFRDLMAPRLRRISDACHERGLLHLFGSDGDLWPVAADLCASGVDGLYEVDRAAGMDLRRLRREYPGVTLIGNISSHTLHLGTVDDVVAETRDCIDVAQEYGGVVVGCSNLIMPETPMANVEAMISTLQLHGAY
jgi:hypothetical protein